ncbi:MAG: M14 family zinc carboxypeptidase [Egibacteraceae bacterium]
MLVNPDGRAYVEALTGDVWWRKNRRPTGACAGIDINRNYDFLWSSGIGTSPDPCDYQIFKGTSAFSESETRNVRALLDMYPNIRCLVDVHSYSEDILYPWGDDNQTTASSLSFPNPIYDGLRGTSADAVYREYIPQSDLDWHQAVGDSVSQAIQAVRGTSDSYCYSRAFADPSLPKVLGITLETGKEFQPPYSEALEIIKEVSAGSVQGCLSTIAIVHEAAQTTYAAP